MKEKNQAVKYLQLKSFISLLLCMCLILLVAGCTSNKSGSNNDSAKNVEDQGGMTGGSTKNDSNITADKSGVPEYLNTGGVLPIVKEGYKKGFSAAVQVNANAGNIEDLWAYKFMKNSMNIDIKIDSFTPQNRSEYISLIFASNNLPDVILNGNLSTNDLMMYGELEGQIIDLAPYLNETYMPYLSGLYNENPSWKNIVMTSEGKIFSFGYINNPADKGQISRIFYNYDWLDKLGLKAPTTLNEFVDMLRAFKTLGDNIIPMGGSYKSLNPSLIILNAFGYNTNDAKGISVALRKGKVVLPVADQEVYGEYLKLMNTLYTEVLIAQDFYTADMTTVQGYISEGRTGVIAQAPFVFTNKFTEWWGAIPLTSDYNDTPFWPESTSAINTGKFVITSSCECPELAAVFADWFFKPTGENYSLFGNGAPDIATDILYGTMGWTMNDETRIITLTEYEKNKDMYSSKNDYLAQKVQLIPFSTLGYGGAGTKAQQLLYGYSWDECIDPYPDPKEYKGDTHMRHTFDNGEAHFRTALQDTMVEYVVETFPGYVYFDPDTSVTVANLGTTLMEYAQQETAKFITGARPLSELDAYFDELERLGAKEYVKYYADYYKALKSN